MSGATTSSSVEKEAAQYKSLRLEKSEHIARVILIGPGKGNSMGPDFWREMPILFSELDQDDQVRVIIISGEGDNFSYGLDLPAMMGQPGFKMLGPNLAAERTRFLDMALEMQKAINGVASCRKPVIAAVHGWCIGAGLDLISACDIRIASSDAKFSLREVKVAIVADMGSLQRLPYIIGEAHTRDLGLTGRDIDAPYAEKIGLVTEVFDSAKALMQGAQKRAEAIAENPPLVVQGIKRVMNQSKMHKIEADLEFVALWNSAFMQSNDLAEAMMAFQQKRPPKFKGN
jgi:enoyl-CoA hydratase